MKETQRYPRPDVMVSDMIAGRAGQKTSIMHPEREEYHMSEQSDSVILIMPHGDLAFLEGCSTAKGSLESRFCHVNVERERNLRKHET